MPVASNATDNATDKSIKDNTSMAVSSEEKSAREDESESELTADEEEGDIFDPEKLVSDKEACRSVSSIRSAVKSPSRSLQDIIQFALTTIEVKRVCRLVMPRAMGSRGHSL